MQLASLLFATSTLVAAGGTPHPADVTAFGSRVEVSAPAILAQSATTGASASRRNPRRFGLGSSLSLSTRELGGNVRFWLNDRLGVTFQASWYRPNSNSGRNLGNQSSTLLVAPSVLYMLMPFDATKDVNLRPYAGGGVNYARTSVPANSTLQQTQDARGVGGQAFGGVELTFAEAEGLAISGEVIHYWVPTSFFNAAAIQGTQFVGSVYFYF